MAIEQRCFGERGGACNYIPDIARYFKSGDLAGFIFPRSLLVIAGEQKRIFPIADVRKNYARIAKIYQAQGKPDGCRRLVGPGGHQHYPELVRPEIKRRFPAEA